MAPSAVGEASWGKEAARQWWSRRGGPWQDLSNQNNWQPGAQARAGEESQHTRRAVLALSLDKQYQYHVLSQSQHCHKSLPPNPFTPPPPGIHRYSKGPERCREQRHRFLCPSPNMPPPPTFLKDSANATIAPRSDFEIVRIYMII